MNTMLRLLGGVLLVAGTTIGAAMLALPIVTGFAGFWPSVFLCVVFWLYMTFTALLMLEVNLWMGEHTNLITMAKKTLEGREDMHMDHLSFSSLFPHDGLYRRRRPYFSRNY